MYFYLPIGNKSYTKRIMTRNNPILSNLPFPGATQFIENQEKIIPYNPSSSGNPDQKDLRILTWKDIASSGIDYTGTTRDDQIISNLPGKQSVLNLLFPLTNVTSGPQ